MKRSVICLALLVAFVVTVALPADVLAMEQERALEIDKPSKAEKKEARKARRVARRGVPEKAAGGGHPLLVAINDGLASIDAEYRVEMAEFITTTDGPDFGHTIFANDRGNKQLSAHWVPGDPRRGGFTDIAYFVDLFDGAATNGGAGLTAAQTTAAIDSAMTTWDNMSCSSIPITNLGAFPVDLGFVQFLIGAGGGAPFFLFDITHGGFLPRGLFDAIFPFPCTPGVNCGGDFILGVTFTFIWLDAPPPAGMPTDIDNNKKLDVAFREIYYNDNFPWEDNGVSNFDVETVALHEAGHGLSQAHFGRISRNPAGQLIFAPRAVMNAAYSGVQQAPTGTDTGGHCSIWGSWPNN